MENQKFYVLKVNGLTPEELEYEMNRAYEKGYKLAFQSNIEWYQGEGLWGIITFELKEE